MKEEVVNENRNRAKALKKKEATRPDEATSSRKADQEPVFPQVLLRLPGAKLWIAQYIFVRSIKF